MPWIDGEDLDKHRSTEAQRRREGETTPGSVYYPGSPPDEDDCWQWCNECRMWHRHAPCF